MQNASVWGRKNKLTGYGLRGGESQPGGKPGKKPIQKRKGVHAPGKFKKETAIVREGEKKKG